MNLNEVRIAEDKDFEVLKIYLSRNDGWNLNFQKGQTAVWTRQAPESEFSMIRVSLVIMNLSFCAIEVQKTGIRAVVNTQYSIPLKEGIFMTMVLHKNRRFRK